MVGFIYKKGFCIWFPFYSAVMVKNTLTKYHLPMQLIELSKMLA